MIDDEKAIKFPAVPPKRHNLMGLLVEIAQIRAMALESLVLSGYESRAVLGKGLMCAGSTGSAGLLGDRDESGW